MTTLHPVLPTTESEHVEFKTSFTDETIVSLVSFSNAKGGTVYIGITDRGEVKRVQNGKETTAQWINEIKNKTTPAIIPNVEVILQDNKTVVALRIMEYPVKPVSIKGRYYKRTGNANHLMSVAEVADLHLQTINSSWDFFLRPEKKLTDISIEKVQKVINTIERRNPEQKIESTQEFLRKKGLTKGPAITNACYLMFCKEQKSFHKHSNGLFCIRNNHKRRSNHIQ